MKGAWTINSDHPMCLIFDVVNPCRKFKRGEVFIESAEEPFADYNPSYEEDPDVTDNDEDNDEGTMAMPYLPLDVKYVSYTVHCESHCLAEWIRCPYEFLFTFPQKWFLNWKKDELVLIYIGRPKAQGEGKKGKSTKAKQGFNYRKKCVYLSK